MFDLSQFSLNGKVAVVTGGDREIGQAIRMRLRQGRGTGDRYQS
jgi:NAD(P)-dependent dehydrogenase (short-subunit alcohol dehydrogenase family)